MPNNLLPKITTNLAYRYPLILMGVACLSFVLFLPGCVEQERTSTGFYQPRADGPKRTKHEPQPQTRKDTQSPSSQSEYLR